MDTSTRVGTAVAAGYLFGRFKKMRLALMIGTALASEDVRKSAVNLVQHGTGGLTSSGAGKIAGTAGEKLKDAGRTAVLSAASSSIERISDRLAQRTQALQGGDEPEDEYDDDEYDDSDDSDEYEDDEDDEEEDAEDDEAEAEDDYDEDYDEDEPEDEYDDDEPEADEEPEDEDEPEDEYDDDEPE